ncbi:MAG: methyltransferase domain-containing protein [Gammaproteobacteria bacterium]|nr:methyltransferase domain-containing protein [Gammaproteobacteria bacterium]MBU1481732.1 methyltransferase domain-containing protein [Gammaproteobacteria bacterium]
MNQIEKQRAMHDSLYKAGSRAHILSDDKLVNYVTKWRMHEAFRRLDGAAGDRITVDTPILFMCAGEGGEASMLCDLGFRDVTVSDISARGVEAAISRDSRLKGLVLNALAADVRDGEYGIVVVQDGLHHLPSPVQGFTEMMRMASVAVVFLEPHDSLVGKLIGTRWEQNGEATNFVFRWTRKLVNDITCSYLCTENFRNLSFSFWHHNIVFRKLGARIGGGGIGIGVISALKVFLDLLFGRFGNQFCGLVVLDRK